MRSARVAPEDVSALVVEIAHVTAANVAVVRPTGIAMQAVVSARGAEAATT